MDGFDDLLAPSRHALEDNPFADPFAKERSSPDPWATPFAATDSHAFGSTSEHFDSLDSYSSSSNNNDFGASSSEFKPLGDDPITNSPAHTVDDDDNEPLGRIRSPGFRESLPAIFSETATIRPTNLEDYLSLASAASTIRTDLANLSPSTQTASSDAQKTPSEFGSTAFSSPPPSATEPGFLSPLDSASSGVERSIAGLSLGGETLGGWQTENQTPWQSEHPVSMPSKMAHLDDDSDDDKPIMQTLKHYDQDDSALVSVYNQYHLFLLTCFRKDVSSYESK